MFFFFTSFHHTFHLPPQLARVHSTASICFHHHILLSFQVLGQQSFGLCAISFTISSSDGCIGRAKGKQRSSYSLFTLVSAPLAPSSFAGRSSLQRYSGAEPEYMGSMTTPDVVPSVVGNSVLLW